MKKFYYTLNYFLVSLSYPPPLANIHPSTLFQIENLQDQLKDKDKQLACLRDRVKSLQTDSSNTDTALVTLEEALSEKVEMKRDRQKKTQRLELNKVNSAV